MANSSGSSSEMRTLAYYERLPRSVRAAVATARFDWALRPWLKAFESGRMNAAELVAHIVEADKRLSARERLKVWGPDYPVLPGEFPTPSKPRRPKVRRS